MLWIFQVFALSANLYGCQVLATNTLTFKSSATTKSHIHHACFCEDVYDKYTLHFKGDRSAAPVLLLVPLQCTLMEQPTYSIDNQQCLAEQDQ